MTATVVVVGDALLDVHAEPATPIRPGADVPATIALEPGGQGANLAVRLARRGAAVRLITALGDDHAGRVLREALGVDGVQVRSVSATATGVVVVLRGPVGERTMLSQRPTWAAAASEILPIGAAWLVISGYCLLEPGADALVRKAAASPARRALIGCSVPGPLLARWRELATSLRADLLVLNQDEAAALGALAGDGAVALTDARGARLTIGGATHRAEVPDGPPAIDTTGAGDAFAATFLAAILGDRWPPDRPGEALAAAVEAAASVARVRGAQARVLGERDATLSA